MSAVESILVLDRLRQSVAVKELEQTRGNQQMSMRKTASVPNFSQVFEVVIICFNFKLIQCCHICIFALIKVFNYTSKLKKKLNSLVNKLCKSLLGSFQTSVP